MAAKSISHCQGKGCLSHNNRVFKPNNVDSSRSSDNITFIKQNISDAYEKCFGSAVERYNAQQKRNDRKILDGYFQSVFNRPPCNSVVVSSEKRKSFYEDLIQIGTKDDTGIGTADCEPARRCLSAYMNGFRQRNPNFYVFNAVLHMDEATPHLHIDYIPIAHCKRGIDTQNGLAQALKEMGYGSGKDAVSRWRASERQVLEEICAESGIEISAPQKSRGYSFSVEEYKELKEVQKQKENEKEELNILKKQREFEKETINSLKTSKFELEGACNQNTGLNWTSLN